jgi:hypothetical protein
VRKDLQANNVAMWMVWETGRKLLREICELLGGSGVCSGSAGDSQNPIRLHPTGKIQSHHGNIKSLNLTPFASHLDKRMSVGQKLGAFDGVGNPIRRRN